jgi:uncharacterized membrane protein
MGAEDAAPLTFLAGKAILATSHHTAKGGHAMASNLVVLAFEGEHTAENMLINFQQMQEEGLLKMEDVVVASRGQGEHVAIKQTHSEKGKHTVRGGGIGLAAGLLLGGPIGGLVAGTVVGAIAGSLKDYGIDDRFIEDVQGYLRPDSSALFLLGEAQQAEKVLERLQPFKAKVLKTTLAEEQEKRLKDTLAEERGV